jgi:hypothetical protein
VWTAGLAAVAAAGLLAAAPAGAQAPPRGATVFVHSAKSGKLGGGRLTLHGVRPRVTWAHGSGRYGVMPVKRLHRQLFPRAKLAATGTLHVAGHRGGDEPIFKLSKPRYNRARRTVSYKAKRLNNKPLASRAAGAAGAARRFGAASLSMVGGTGNTLDVDTSTYPGCGGVCWGKISASGLHPGSFDLSVSIPVPGGNTGQATETDYRADANGDVNVQLNLPCNVPTPVTVEAYFNNGQYVSNDYNPPFPVRIGLQLTQAHSSPG